MAIFYVYFRCVSCLFCSVVCSFSHCIVIFFMTLLDVWLIILILKISYSVLYNILLIVCFGCILYCYVNILFSVSLYINHHHLHNNILRIVFFWLLGLCCFSMFWSLTQWRNELNLVTYTASQWTSWIIVFWAQMSYTLFYLRKKMVGAGMYRSVFYLYT